MNKTRVVAIALAGVVVAWWWRKYLFQRKITPPTTTDDLPGKLSVNYHITRICNYRCGFCFHQPKKGSKAFPLTLEQAKLGLRKLAEYGLSKINFAGGEPFYIKKGRIVGELCKFCKSNLKIKMVSVVTNGSCVTEEWFEEYGDFLDMMAVSIDSFDETVNEKIGRHAPGKNHVEIAYKVSELCHKYNVCFKINTVVNRFNTDEDMNAHIEKLNPMRWKVFQCLIIEGENSNGSRSDYRDGQEFVVSDDEFKAFLDRHDDVACLVPEDNTTMRNSYLILDEYMRFLNCTENGKDPGLSILDVGVESALNGAGFDEVAFLRRGGNYTFSKGDQTLEW